jgi:hypothetical protein
VKTIVICGGGSKSGKTRAATFLSSILPNAYVIKLGSGTFSEEKDVPLFPVDADFRDFSDTIPPETEYLIIESGHIANKISPDCLIFVEKDYTEDSRRAEFAEPKESTHWLREKADLVSGKTVTCQKACEIAHRLGIQKHLIGHILNTLGIKVTNCQLGLF